MPHELLTAVKVRCSKYGDVCGANIQKAAFNFSLKVADFGGTLSLFLGVSFITIWDNFHFLYILDILRSKCDLAAHKREPKS